MLDKKHGWLILWLTEKETISVFLLQTKETQPKTKREKLIENTRLQKNYGRARAQRRKTAARIFTGWVNSNLLSHYIYLNLCVLIIHSVVDEKWHSGGYMREFLALSCFYDPPWTPWSMDAAFQIDPANCFYVVRRSSRKNDTRGQKLDGQKEGSMYVPRMCKEVKTWIKGKAKCERLR